MPKFFSAMTLLNALYEKVPASTLVNYIRIAIEGDNTSEFKRQLMIDVCDDDSLDNEMRKRSLQAFHSIMPDIVLDYLTEGLSYYRQHAIDHHQQAHSFRSQIIEVQKIADYYRQRCLQLTDENARLRLVQNDSASDEVELSVTAMRVAHEVLSEDGAPSPSSRAKSAPSRYSPWHNSAFFKPLKLELSTKLAAEPAVEFKVP